MAEVRLEGAGRGAGAGRRGGRRLARLVVAHVAQTKPVGRLTQVSLLARRSVHVRIFGQMCAESAPLARRGKECRQGWSHNPRDLHQRAPTRALRSAVSGAV